MKPALKKEWIRRLESGNYRQTRGVLLKHKTNRAHYCCLGVLATCMPKASMTYRQMRAKENLFNAVAQTEVDITDRQQDHLVAMNDDYYKSFKEIAQYIRKNIK